MTPCEACPVAGMPGVTCESIWRNSPVQCRHVAQNPRFAAEVKARSLDPEGWRPSAPPATEIPAGKRDRIDPASAPARRPADAPPCIYLGLPLPGEDGEQATRRCGTCRGEVRLKLWACLHPGHDEHPETTARDCTRCPDYEAGPSDDRASNATGTSHELNYWRGGN
jgi:hypothetical protein